LKTSDDGTNWNDVYLGNQILSGFTFINSSIGYAVGDSGTIIKTNNGGSSWVLLPRITNHAFLDVCFPTIDTGYIVGKDFDNQCGIILKTTDGGSNWTFLSTSSTPLFGSVFFINSQVGWVVGSAIIKTTDGGNSWIPYGTNYSYLWDVDFANNNIGFIVGENGLILRTTDAGENWSVLPSGVANALMAVESVDSNIVYACGRFGIILSTEDAGNTWTPQWSGTYKDLCTINFSGPNTGFAAGYYGTILKTDNGGGFPVDVNYRPSVESCINVCPNPSTDKITIEISEKELSGHIEIIDVRGNVVINKEFRGGRIHCNISPLKTGIYVLKAVSENQVQFGKFIKE
jgi:photosystem II stability/assembly factor-like uncharacterized protein